MKGNKVGIMTSRQSYMLSVSSFFTSVKLIQVSITRAAKNGYGIILIICFLSKDSFILQAMLHCSKKYSKCIIYSKAFRRIQIMKKRFLKQKRLLKNIMTEAGLDVHEDFSAELNEYGELTVSGCNEILKYTDDNITLKSRDYYLDIYGDNILLKMFSVKKSVIGGEISDVKLLKAGDKNAQ